MNNRPRVGIGLLVVRLNPEAPHVQVLLGRRRNAHGAGEYAGAGGHLEHGESFTGCALRELAEEAGTDLKVSQPEFLCLTNICQYENLHYVDVGMTAYWQSGEPVLMEPDKLDGWGWYDINNLPDPLFACLPNYIASYRNETGFFDTCEEDEDVDSR